MPFGIIGRTGPGMRQVVGFGDQFTEGVLLGANLGRTVVTNGDFMAYVLDSTALFPNNFGQTCCVLLYYILLCIGVGQFVS